MKVSEVTPPEARRYSIELEHDESYYLIFYLAEARKKHQFIEQLCTRLGDVRGDFRPEVRP